MKLANTIVNDWKEKVGVAKVNKFLFKVVIVTEDNIEALNRQLDDNEKDYKRYVKKGLETILDAKEVLKEAYKYVAQENIETHAKMDEHLNDYINNLTKCETTVRRLENDQLDFTSNYEKGVITIKEQIARYEARLVVLTAK